MGFPHFKVKYLTSDGVLRTACHVHGGLVGILATSGNKNICKFEESKLILCRVIKNWSSGFPTRPDTNCAVQPQKLL